MSTLTIVIPTLNEEQTLPSVARNLKALDPQPDHVLVVDGGSTDRTVPLAQELGLKVVVQEPAGRARQINRGVEEATTDVICVLHADTRLPSDAVDVVRTVLRNQNVALAGFTAILSGDQTTRWATSFHNWIKTWYAPLLFRPHLFFRGCRLLFG
ncbi:MAG: glycosyltransferase, partial [Pseudomonadota bacterium]